MKKQDEKIIDGIESVNNELYDDMYVNELENRLETDPLLSGGLLDLISSGNAAPGDIDFCANVILVVDILFANMELINLFINCICMEKHTYTVYV